MIDKNIHKEQIITEIDKINESLAVEGANVNLLIERAKLYMKIERRDLALNDFNQVLTIEPDNVEANSYVMMISSIDRYYYTDTYNP